MPTVNILNLRLFAKKQERCDLSGYQHMRGRCFNDCVLSYAAECTDVYWPVIEDEHITIKPRIYLGLLFVFEHGR